VGETRNAYSLLIRKAERKSLLEKPRRQWEDDIKMDIKERGWEGVDRIYLAKDRDKEWAFVNMLMLKIFCLAE
jgi:hypothetical protein